MENQKKNLPSDTKEKSPFDAGYRVPLPSAAKEIFLSFAAMSALTLLVFFCNVPNPNIILITGLTVFTSLYGYGAGVACAAVMTLYSMFFFSENHDFVTYDALNLQKMASILLGVTLNVLFIGRLKKVNDDAHYELMKLNRILQEDNLYLEQASAVDALTGTRNRFAFRRDYEKFEGRNIHVMMFDLDDFKSTNDTYGHAAGDFVLQQTGKSLREAFGDEHCYRYGGDEFLVVRPDTEDGEFSWRLQQIRERLHGLSLDSRRIPSSFSAGYVYGRVELSADLRLMLHYADHNLYEAKERGKDCFVGSEYSRAYAERLEKNLHSRHDAAFKAAL